MTYINKIKIFKCLLFWFSTGGSINKDGATSTVGVLDSSREKKSLDDQYIGIIIGALSALILLLFIVIVIIIIRQRRRKYNNNHRVMKIIESKHVTLDLNDLQNNTLNGKLSNGNMYNFVATSDGESDREGASVKIENHDLYNGGNSHYQQRALPDLPHRTPDSGSGSYPRLHLICQVLCLLF